MCRRLAGVLDFKSFIEGDWVLHYGHTRGQDRKTKTQSVIMRSLTAFWLRTIEFPQNYERPTALLLLAKTFAFP